MKDAARPAPILGWVDRPLKDQRIYGVTTVDGWVLQRGHGEVTIELRIDGEPVIAAIERLPRPDVLAAYPTLAAANARPGFTAAINVAAYANGPYSISVVARCAGHSSVLGAIEVFIENSEDESFFKRAYIDKGTRERGRRKLGIVVDVLVCPACREKVELGPGEDHLICRKCAAAYPVRGHVPIMVTDKPEFPVDASLLESPASNNGYPPTVLTRLEETFARGGIALDVGAGRRSFGADGLVQLEICTYPFTDVVNQGELLPFRDESFDFVFSLAVTEHVRRPWVLAAEMQRVLKPGGQMVVDSAFMQPLHGYPRHYFNMTNAALRDLFCQLDVDELKPAAYQHPYFGLSWMLGSLFRDLGEPDRRRLADMTVGQLLDQMKAFCRSPKEPTVLAKIALGEDKLSELAAGFTLLGRKPYANEERRAANGACTPCAPAHSG